jgi:aspartate aminotransferase-like enzyme
MTGFDARPLLDVPPLLPSAYGELADRLKRLLGTAGDLVFVEAEAVVALEAVAASLGRPGLSVLDIVTSPYGDMMGDWLHRTGASVTRLAAAPAAPVTIDAVREVLAGSVRFDAVVLSHADSASGILNPLEEIATLARSRGMLTVVDAVASFGGHALDVDGLGLDVVVVGPQKALAGPAGLSAVTLGARAWDFIDRPDAPRRSVLSLADRRAWTACGRGLPSSTPSLLDWQALGAALDRFEAEGLATAIARHARASEAARDGLAGLGLVPWPERGDASHLVTAVRLPEAIDRAALLAALPPEAEIGPGIGPGTERLVRLNHTGRRASPEVVAAMIAALRRALAAIGA